MFLRIILIQLLVLTTILQENVVRAKCIQRDYGNGGTVCVCKEKNCDNLPTLQKSAPHTFQLFVSNQKGLRMERFTGNFNNVQEDKEDALRLFINQSAEMQSIIGWGGAFTDAACINILNLTQDMQEELLKSYFSKSGIEFNLGRVPIGATDFSTYPYSYDDGPEDKNLTNFSLNEIDYKLKIPTIKRSIKLSEGNLNLFASPWTAPKWMKFNGNYSGMFGFIKDEMYQSWADYFLKFLQSYEKEDVHFWGITTGNEPSLAFTPARINSVAWLPHQMGNFLVNNLGPTLRKSKYKDIKIMTIDDQRLALPWFLDFMFLFQKKSKEYVDGVAVHWYMDKIFSANLLTQTYLKYPEKFILATEACKGDSELEPRGVLLGSWKRGEDYASSIIEDINHYVSGWLDWNLALDLTGGPTYIGNNVDAQIVVNKTANEFYKQPMYYTFGHFSKFVPKNSVRVHSEGLNSTKVVATAFKRPDNGVVVQILNKSNKTEIIEIEDDNRGIIQLNLTEKSLNTVIYW